MKTVDGQSLVDFRTIILQDATCTEDGNEAYYICDGCDKWFEDAQGKSEITDKTSVIIPAAGHTLSDWKADDNSHWHECECGYKADVAQIKAQISYTLSTLKNLLPSTNYTCRQKKN